MAITEVVWDVATQIFVFSPRNIGEDSHFDEHIFQRGWFNQQLVNQLYSQQTLQFQMIT